MTEGPGVHNDISGNVVGNVYQAGTLHVTHDRPAVRSAYREQVRQIAPFILRGRQPELTELAEFCTASDGPAYWWYRAEAWAGKSALMSWFALHPPPGVRVVSFFITARFFSQDDRVAFVDVVMEQLAELLGQPMPAYLTDATRDSHLLGMLTEAATLCFERGERLILLVDGLDEDRGATTHSIAALLPAQPAAGMRVLVAGRQNPPIPPDVPHKHPLHDPAIVHPLASSRHAETIKQHAQQELKRLLHGTAAEQNLLGLIAAAGGGLSGADLAALTGWPAWQVADHLQAVSGRTFTPRRSHWSDDDVYVLAHEELQQAAITFLGPARIAEYRASVHNWADHHNAQSWPAGTPEYLLRGYFRLLQQTNDLPRMLALATDSGRHNRMRDVTGGDAQALTEITATQQAVLDQSDPDLAAMVRLAMHRSALLDRNANIPIALPTVWAALGQHTRADALVDSIGNPINRIEALAEWARYSASQADVATARELLDRIATIAPTIDDSVGRRMLMNSTFKAALASADMDIAMALLNGMDGEPPDDVLADAVARGSVDQAIAVASGVEDVARRAEALEEVTKALVTAGQFERAVTTAQRVPLEYERTWLQRHLVQIALAAGDLARAERIADSITGTKGPGDALVKVVAAIAAMGDVDRAEARARAIDNDYYREAALAEIVTVVANRGDHDRAESIAGDILWWPYRENALIALLAAPGLAVSRAEELLARLGDAPLAVTRGLCAMATAAGNGEYARQQVDRARRVAKSITDPGDLVKALIAVIVCDEDPDRNLRYSDRAITLALSLPPAFYSGALPALFSALATSGRQEMVVTIADQHPDEEVRRNAKIVVSETAVRGGATTFPPIVARPGLPEIGLSNVVREVVVSGEIDRAESLAHSIADVRRRDETLAVVAAVTAAAGDIDRAVAISGQIAAEYHRGRALNSVAQADTGCELDWVAVAASVDSRYWQARILSTAAFVAVEAGHPDQATTLAEQAEKVARAGYVWAAVSFAQLAVVVAVAGDADRARALADQVDADVVRPASPDDQINILVNAIELAAAIGDHDRANWLLTRLLGAAGQLAEPELATRLVVEAMAAVGKLTQAEAQARTLAAPDDIAAALTAVADAAMKTGETDLARRLVGDILDLAEASDPYVSDQIRADIVITIAALGELDRAENLAVLIGDRSKCTTALASLAQHLAVSGEIERADTILALTTRNARTAEIVLLGRAVAALAGATTGDRAAALVERAEELARSITVPSDRAQVLSEVALAAPERARRLVAEAFQVTEDWTIPLRALAKVDPAVVIEIADDLLASRAAGGQ